MRNSVNNHYICWVKAQPTLTTETNMPNGVHPTSSRIRSDIEFNRKLDVMKKQSAEKPPKNKKIAATPERAEPAEINHREIADSNRIAAHTAQKFRPRPASFSDTPSPQARRPVTQGRTSQFSTNVASPVGNLQQQSSTMAAGQVGPLVPKLNFSQQPKSCDAGGQSPATSDKSNFRTPTREIRFGSGGRSASAMTNQSDAPDCRSNPMFHLLQDSSKLNKHMHRLSMKTERSPKKVDNPSIIATDVMKQIHPFDNDRELFHSDARPISPFNDTNHSGPISPVLQNTSTPLSVQQTGAGVVSNGTVKAATTTTTTTAAVPAKKTTLSNNEFAFRKKLVLKELGMLFTDNISNDQLNRLILRAYAYETFNLRHHQAIIKTIFLSNNDGINSQKAAQEIRKAIQQKNSEIKANGTLATILRFFDAQTEATASDNTPTSKNSLGEKAFLLAAQKLGLKESDYMDKEADVVARKMVDKYIHPPFFSLRNHHDWLRKLDFNGKNALQCYELIVEKIMSDKRDVNPKGTLIMMLNALKQLADRSVPQLKANTDIVSHTQTLV